MSVPRVRPLVAALKMRDAMKCAWILVSMLLAFPGYGQRNDDGIDSDRPGFADSSKVVPRSRVQLEAGFQREVRRVDEDPRRQTILPALLRLGVADKWEARLESELFAWTRHPDGTRSEAWAPYSIGFKHQLLEAQGSKPTFGVIARLSPPSGSKVQRTQHTTGDMRLAADFELGPQWSINPNIGFGWDEDNEGRRFSTRLLAMTLAYKPMDRLEVFADFLVQDPEAHGAGSGVIYDAGIAYRVSRDVQLDFSFGSRGSGSTFPRNFLAAGFSVRF
jgi:hypothetical protein